MSRGRSRTEEAGAVAIIVAVSMTALVVIAAMVLDFGLARLDRQGNKLAADSAVTAGMLALDGGTGEVYSYRGVCEAIEYLRENRADLAGLAWSACAVPANEDIVCQPGNSATFARFEQSVTAPSGSTYLVQVRIPYTDADLLEFPEETLATLAADRGDSAELGCDQIGVNIRQMRDPGLGSLATDDEVGSRIRSVGRVTIGEEGQGAVALLLLEREDCRAIDTVGGASVLVKGTATMPGMIHTDSLGNGDDCNSTNRVFNGNHTDGIVAEASQDGAFDGLLTTRALSGEASAVPANATDPIPEVYGGPYPPGTAPDGRGLVTRKPVDNRYLEPVRNFQTTAHTMAAWTPAEATAAAGWTVSADCNLSAAEKSAVKLYVNCPGNPGFNKANVDLPNATDVIFSGKVKADNLTMPKAERVYIYGDWSGGNPVGLEVSPTLRIHHFGNATCSELPTGDSGNRATLFIAGGALKSANSSAHLQLCNTTVVFGSGASGSYLPLSAGADPVDNLGTGFIQISGGSQDWTAPNSTSDAADASLWDQFEDLALWTEAYGSHSIAGGGNMHLSGIFMLPEANAFNIKGGGLQDVENSQYVARKLNVTGTGTLTMMPNPNDVVTIQILGGFDLVR